MRLYDVEETKFDDLQAARFLPPMPDTGAAVREMGDDHYTDDDEYGLGVFRWAVESVIFAGVLALAWAAAKFSLSK